MSHRASSRSRWLIALSVLLVGLVVAIAIAAALAPTLLPTGDQMGGEGRNVRPVSSLSEAISRSQSAEFRD
jgi:hypothetical protein